MTENIPTYLSALAEGEQRLALLAKTLVLVTQNMGRTGPIDLAQGEISWAALLGISLLWLVVSACVVIVSVRSGMRRLAWGWAVSFLVGLLVAAYSFWSL